MIFYLVMPFILGLGVGSFLNVVILRGSRGESFIKGRSRCEACKKTLSWFELIPLVSFAMQKGRCRSCGSRLSWQYPLVEFLTGALFSFSVWLIPGDQQFVILNGSEGSILEILRPVELPAGDSTGLRLTQNDLYAKLFYLLGLWLIVSAFIVILISDIRWKIIPNGAVLTLLGVGIARAAWSWTNGLSVFYGVAAALGLALFFFALWFSSKGRWMGFGDAKLILATSLILGFPASIAAALFSFWIGGIFGILLLTARLADLKTQIPFGPFILAGGALAFFYTESFLWYAGLSVG